MVTTRISVLVVLTAILGCGMFKQQSVPKEQIDTDIATKVVDVQEGDEKKWIFEADDQRCFSVMDGESNFTDSGADVVVVVGSYQEMELSGNTTYMTVFGKMLLKYKRDGDKWTLQSIEPTDLISKNLKTTDQFKKWLEIQAPNCNYSRFVK